MPVLNSNAYHCRHIAVKAVASADAWVVVEPGDWHDIISGTTLAENAKLASIQIRATDETDPFYIVFRELTEDEMDEMHEDYVDPETGGVLKAFKVRAGETEALDCFISRSTKISTITCYGVGELKATFL